MVRLKNLKVTHTHTKDRYSLSLSSLVSSFLLYECKKKKFYTIDCVMLMIYGHQLVLLTASVVVVSKTTCSMSKSVNRQQVLVFLRVVCRRSSDGSGVASFF